MNREEIMALLREHSPYLAAKYGARTGSFSAIFWRPCAGSRNTWLA